MSMSGMEAKRSGKIILKKENGAVIDDPKEVAEDLNNFFVDKVNKIVESHPPDPVKAKEYTERYIRGKKITPMSFHCVTEADVIQIVRDVKSTGAVGSDGISMILLKKIILTVVGHLTNIVNLALLSSKYPRMFKVGQISPVPKTGSLYEAKNWRPVVILNAASKIVERCINNQLKTHLIRNELIS